jgi:hypothetical protein
MSNIDDIIALTDDPPSGCVIPPPVTPDTNSSRIAECSQLLLAGYTAADIWREKKITWKCGKKEINKYCGIARQVWEADLTKQIDFQLTTAIARRDDLYRRAIAAGDLELALTIEKDKAELLRLYAHEGSLAKAQVQSELVNMSDTELLNIVITATKPIAKITCPPRETIIEAQPDEDK